MKTCFATLIRLLPIFVPVLFSFFAVPIASAQTADDNVIITHREEKYTFEQRGGEVFIREKSVTDYEATKIGRSVTISEFYDDQSAIDKVSANKKIKPQYNLYTDDNLFYSDARVCHFKLPFDSKGATAQVKFEKSYKDPRYFTTVYLSEPFFVRRKTVEITVPQWMDVELNERNFGDNIRKDVRIDSKTGSRVYTYHITGENAMKKEVNMPGRSHIYPHILFLTKSSNTGGVKTTYFETLDDLYGWYHSLVSQLNTDRTVIGAQAAAITASCTTDEEKIRALFAWVQRHIRYIAFEDGIAGFKPDEAHEVLRKKYGDCKGMSNLLKELLVAAGFDARLSWVGTNHLAYDYSTPCLSADNHMICTLFWNDRMYFLDPTIKYMPLGEYPHTIQGRQTLIEESDPARYRLETIPAFTPELNTDSLYGEFILDGGTLMVDARQYYMGESKQRLLSLMDSTPKERLDDAIRNFLESGKSQDAATDIRLEGVESQTRAVELLYRLNYKSGLQSVAGEYYIDLDTEKEFMNSDVDTEKRRHPVEFDYKHRVVKHLVFTIPQGYRVTHLPGNLDIDRDGYRIRLSYEQSEGRVTFRKEIAMKNILLPKENFTQWNEDIARLRNAYMEQMAISPTE